MSGGYITTILWVIVVVVVIGFLWCTLFGTGFC